MEPGVMELSVTSVLAGFSEPGGWSGGDIGIPFFFPAECFSHHAGQSVLVLPIGQQNLLKLHLHVLTQVTLIRIKALL